MTEITTIVAKKKMLFARAGIQLLPQITQMAFGSGGVDLEGEVVELTEGQKALNDEIFRKDIDQYEVISDTQIEYKCTLAEGELVGKKISEIALVDAEGDLLAIKHFTAKEKDDGWQMTFKINDSM